ncbi:hypothetical protein [Streptomyces mirabilis]|uniref:hypothetical protein n=1 Tax=Streptomyces mirabilis TaxID=68239 RepID=UPI0036BAD930
MRNREFTYPLSVLPLIVHAVETGAPEPAVALAVPESVRGALLPEIVKCWIVAAEGQLSDLCGDAATATRDSVATAYRGKSGAPFSMVTVG